MDSGAHFFKCDFQVHSPRDRQWTGRTFGVDVEKTGSLTPEEIVAIKTEREQFAKEYLEKIRKAGLNAIAITDHHDFVFAKLIRKVSEDQNKNFIANFDYKSVVTVFPGMEVTLSNPASQCLLIFDSNFEDNSLDSVLSFFGISPAGEYAKWTAETVRISQDIIPDLVQLHKKLDELAYCKGRYIIFPNVNDHGASSILRQGFHEHYRKMPCVGGYVDGELSKEAGYVNKLAGGDIHYGNKAIGVISTSDNRFEDGRLFGKFATWIKWASPTAEALRQACLAKESRLSQKLPDIPQVYITQIDVTNSRFLGSFSQEYNQQYNALIGGRGTGKSTILEYLRWGLCDQGPSDEEDRSEVEKRRQSLIEKTLVPFGGEVRITFSLNGIQHIVKRNPTTKEINLKIGDGDFGLVKEEEVRRILPVQAYSQKQLSSVGVRTEELKRFIQQPVINQLNNLGFQISDNSKRMRVAYSNYARKKELGIEVTQFELEIQSLSNQVENLRKTLSGLNEKDQVTISKKQRFDNESSLISSAQGEFDTINNKVKELNSSLSRYPEPYPPGKDLENVELMTLINDARTKLFQQIKASTSKLEQAIAPVSRTEFNNQVATWKKMRDEFEKEYSLAKEKASANKAQLDEIGRIETRLRELERSVSERKSTLKELGDPESDFDRLRSDWYRLHHDKIHLLEEQAKDFTALSKGLIKADMSQSTDLDQIKSQLALALQGTRISDAKIQGICDSILAKGIALDNWRDIVNELRILAELKISEGKKSEIPDTPLLASCDLNTSNRTKIAEILTPERWIAIATFELEFVPKFSYTTNSQLGDVIPFADASAGQQATALLTVLLNQSGAPLIIDQPEDDIDNRAIDDIIKNIWQSKKSRQLIFTSHNANLVVNGDAELVICCDYRDSGNQTRGVIKAIGAIDSKIIRDEITSVMEGGEKAFRLRKDKYGF